MLVENAALWVARYLQNSTAGCTDKRSDRHIYVGWSSLMAIKTSLIVNETDDLP